MIKEVWQKIKPSKHILYVLLVAVFFITIMVLAKKGLFSQIEFKKKQNVNLPDGELTVGELTQKDSDGDGIYDWEEVLWGTNPELSDSDDDGITDGEEIKAKKAELGVSSTENLTNTEAFSREYFATIMSLAESGNIGLAEAINSEVFSELLSEERDYYTENDLNISEQNILVYFDNAIRTANKYGTENIDPYTALLTYFENSDPAELSKIQDYATKIESIENELLNLKVHEKEVDTHLLLINSFRWLREDAEDMAKAESDSILALRGVARYNNDIVIMQAALTNLFGRALDEIE